jgi:anti-sigma factor RsiW
MGGCGVARKERWAWREGLLSDADGARLAAHAPTCAHCARDLDEHRRLTESLRAFAFLPAGAGPSATFDQTLLARRRREIDRDGARARPWRWIWAGGFSALLIGVALFQGHRATTGLSSTGAASEPAAFIERSTRDGDARRNRAAMNQWSQALVRETL